MVPGGMPALDRINALAARLAATAGFAAAGLLLTLAGIGLLMAALYLWLASLVAPPLAALLTALVLFSLAGMVMLFGRLMVKSRYRRVTARAPAAATSQAEVATLIGSELGVAGLSALKGHVPQVVLAAAAAGFLIAVSPRLRAAIRRQL